LKRLDASCSADEPRWESIESISSKNNTHGFLDLAVIKSALSNFSDSPRHFDVNVAELQLKKVMLSVLDATAFANIDLPVPGGPKKQDTLPWFANAGEKLFPRGTYRLSVSKIYQTIHTTSHEFEIQC